MVHISIGDFGLVNVCVYRFRKASRQSTNRQKKRTHLRCWLLLYSKNGNNFENRFMLWRCMPWHIRYFCEFPKHFILFSERTVSLAMGCGRATLDEWRPASVTDEYERKHKFIEMKREMPMSILPAKYSTNENDTHIQRKKNRETRLRNLNWVSSLKRAGRHGIFDICFGTQCALPRSAVDDADNTARICAVWRLPAKKNVNLNENVNGHVAIHEYFDFVNDKT